MTYKMEIPTISEIRSFLILLIIAFITYKAYRAFKRVEKLLKMALNPVGTIKDAVSTPVGAIGETVTSVTNLLPKNQ